MRLQNEVVSEIKQKLCNSIRIIVEKIQKPRQKTLFEHCFSWLEDQQMKIKKSGIDVIKFFIFLNLYKKNINIIKCLRFFFEIFEFGSKYEEIKAMSLELCSQFCSEITEYQKKKRELLLSKKKLKKNVFWNDYLFKEEENELEKEKITSKHLDLFASLLDFYKESLLSTKNQQYFVRILFEKQAENHKSLFDYIIVLLAHTNEKVLTHCLSIIEMVVRNNYEKFKEIYESQIENIQGNLINPLMKIFLRSELLENTENLLFNSIYCIFQRVYGNNVQYLEMNFSFLRKKMIKFLVSV